MDVLLFGDTERQAALRHELPLVVIDPLVYAEVGGRRFCVTSVLEEARVAEAAPDVEVLLFSAEVIERCFAEGRTDNEAIREATVHALATIGLREATVPGDFPLAVAERLRAEGVELRVDESHFEDRRRVKSAAELAGIRNAQAAALHGMEAAAQLLRDATARDGVLYRGPVPLTCEDVRARVRDACAAHGAPAPPDIIVRDGQRASGGHDPGSGELRPGAPVVVDLWPRDEASGCWADMTRTFCVGELPPALAEHHELVLRAHQAGLGALRPGVRGADVFDAAAEVFEAAGHPTQRTKAPGEQLREGFYWSLGHGVGLEVHEEPGLGRSGGQPLVAGDVLALEPGTTWQGVGEVRVEDLVLVTPGGYELLTDFPYDLAP